MDYNYNYQFNDCAVYDYRGLQQSLESLAEKGWRLDRVTNYGIWRYRAAEPAKVRYEITYVADGDETLPNPTESELEMEDLCTAAGWEKVASLGQMQIYCCEDPEAPPLETDEAVRLKSIQKAMSKSFVKGRLWVMGLMAMQMILRLWHLFLTPVEFVTSRAYVYLLGLALWFFLVTALELGLYALWSRRSEKSVADGLGCLSQGSFRWVRRGGMVCSLLVLLGMGWVYSWGTAALLLGGIGLILVLGSEYGAQLKTKGKSSDGNIVLIIALIVIFSALMGSRNAEQRTAEITGARREMAVTMELLTNQEETYGYTVADCGTTPLGMQTYYHQELNGESIGYSVVEVKCPILRSLCTEDLVTSFRGFKWSLKSPDAEALDPGAWNAQQVWHCEDYGHDRWLICYEDRIVSFSASWPLTAEQQAALAAAFAGEYGQ